MSQRVGHDPGRSKNQWRKALLTLIFAFLGFKRAQEILKPLLLPPLIPLARSEQAKKHSSDQLNVNSNIWSKVQFIDSFKGTEWTNLLQQITYEIYWRSKCNGDRKLILPCKNKNDYHVMDICSEKFPRKIVTRTDDIFVI